MIYVLYIEQNTAMSNSEKKGYSQTQVEKTYEFLYIQLELYVTTTPASYTIVLKSVTCGLQDRIPKVWNTT